RSHSHRLPCCQRHIRQTLREAYGSQGAHHPDGITVSGRERVALCLLRLPAPRGIPATLKKGSPAAVASATCRALRIGIRSAGSLPIGHGASTRGATKRITARRAF